MPQGVVLPVRPDSVDGQSFFRSQEISSANALSGENESLQARILYYIIYSSKSEKVLDLQNLDSIIPVSDTSGIPVNAYDIVEFDKTPVLVIRTITAKITKKVPRFPFFRFIIKAAILSYLFLALALKKWKKK